MKLIITRHGETIENREGIIQGQLPGTLSDLGVEQAKKVAKRLKDEKLDAIYSSDLARSADTAGEIGKFHPKVKISYVQALRERDLGEYQGKRMVDVGIDPKNFKWSLVKPKQGETVEQLFFRAEGFLDKILHKHHKDTVLFVGHDGINKAIIAVITGKKPADFASIEVTHNASISIYEIDEEKNHKIHLFNCIKHLG